MARKGSKHRRKMRALRHLKLGAHQTAGAPISHKPPRHGNRGSNSDRNTGRRDPLTAERMATELRGDHPDT